MRQNYKKAGTVLLRCSIFIALGVWMIAWPHLVELVAHKGTLALLFVLSFIDVLEWIAYSPKRSHQGLYKLLSALAYIGLLGFVWLLPHLYLSFFSLAFGLWMLLNAILKSISFVQYQINKVEGRLLLLLLAVLSYGFGIFLLLHPQANIRTVIFALGIYLLAFGITHLGDLFRTLGITHRFGIKRGFRLSLPVLLAALIPYGMIRKVNDLIDDETIAEKRHRRHALKTPYEVHDETDPPDLEVFVHVSPQGFSRFGHVDICFEGTMLVYGCYNDRSRHIGRMFGEGNMIITEKKETYLAFCCYENKKTIYGFGFRLTEEQKANLRKAIGLIVPLLAPHYPDSQLMVMGKMPRQVYNDYASRLYRVTGARFYKFTSGKFKSYFSLGTNCVLLADTLIGATGSDIISMTGVVTPGTYYDYLNRQFLIKNSNVISRKVYTEHNQKAVIETFLDRL